MAASDRAVPRRGPTGAWSRLKPSSSDTLESYGLPSKGETRLNDLKAQEIYYHKIVDRWLKFCADSGNSAELEKQFASLSVRTVDAGAGESSSDGRARGPGKLQKNDVHKSLVPASPSVPPPELAAILMAMRKLREATVAMSRTDMFAQRAYAFMIRTAIVLKSMESYLPALLYMLHHIHPRTQLPASELQEFLGYYILDLACRQGDFNGAYTVKQRFGHRDRRIERIVDALVHDNWVVFWMVKGKVDGHVRALMSWAEDRMQVHALKCLGRSYFTAEKDYVERCTDLKWDMLVKQMSVGWVLEDDKVTIRRPKSQQ